VLHGSILVGDGKPNVHSFVVAIPKRVNPPQEPVNHLIDCRAVMHATTHTTRRIFKTTERHVVEDRDPSVDMMFIDKGRQHRDRPHGKKQTFSANDEVADAGWVAPCLDL